MKKQTTIIVGANSEIAKALALKIIVNKNIHLIIISRNISFYQTEQFKDATLITISSYEENEIRTAAIAIEESLLYNINNLFICHGVLHNKRCQPEKRLEDFSADSFTEIFTANTITPMLWLKHLTPILTSKAPCKVVIFTARVGSISDNKLGGWYSYRASKAAMNMLITSVAVELARRAKNIKLISFHPGTTNTPLSKPFQKNVPEGKLFTSEFVAKQLLKITNETIIDGTATYIDWEGKIIPW